MTIEFACPFCETTLRTSDERAGWQAKCPSCTAIINIPETRDSQHADEQWDEAPLPASLPDAPVAPRPDSRALRFDTCPMCGAEVAVYKRHCPACGEQIYRRTAEAAETDYQREHRAPLILAFGIASWFLCPVFGIAAWVLANEELAGMKLGTVNPDGEVAVRIGRAIAATNLIAIAAFLLFACLIVSVARLAA